MVYMSLELTAGTSTSMAFGVRNDTHWTDGITFQGLSSTEWRTFTWAFPIPSTGRITLITGVKVTVGEPSSNVVWIEGTVLLRNFHLYLSSDLATISAPLVCEKDVTFNASLEAQHAYIKSITAGQYFSSSDQRIKNDIRDASLQSCQEVFDAVSVKTYERTDLAPGKRIGFIAQDIQQSLPGTGEFANLVGTRPGKDGEELLTIDYSRLLTIAWAQLKIQQAQIADLTSRLEALEEAQ
jgi:hypothetical protein